MPYRSESQRKWAHTAAGKKALGGEAAVEEWDQATKGKKLPEKVKKSEMKKFGGMMQLSLNETKTKSPMRTGTHQTSVKTSKQKHMPGPDAKPSVFFKSENGPKHPSVQKLYTFLTNRRNKKSRSSNL